MTEQETGRPIPAGDAAFPRVAGATLDARGAAALALKSFLEGVNFWRDSGDALPAKNFALNRVYEAWPDSNTELDYPCASITDASSSDMGEHALSPTCLDDTHEQFGACTVLWKIAELEQEFQVDFFANDEPTRQAIMAALPGAMSPDEDRAGVVVQGSPRYFCRPVRLTLLSYRRTDNPNAVFERERRVVCRVSAEVDVVVLRKVAVFRPRIGVAVTTTEE